ncbi:MAG: hypothetical protein RIR54_423, partial [Actinomycetota bacterium]
VERGEVECFEWIAERDAGHVVLLVLDRVFSPASNANFGC